MAVFAARQLGYVSSLLFFSCVTVFPFLWTTNFLSFFTLQAASGNHGGDVAFHSSEADVCSVGCGTYARIFNSLSRLLDAILTFFVPRNI